MLPRLASAALLLFVVIAGCKSENKDSPTDAAVAKEAAASTAASANAPAAPVTEADAKAVLDKWLAAQNESKFADYEALYAPRFEGVRRSGTQTARLDRARWMKERERMFQKNTSVEAKDVAITPAHEGADIRFMQSWAQEGYKDEGPKRMVLTRVKGVLKIAREELLRSNVLAPSVIAPEKFAFAIHTPSPHLVLSDAPKDEWMTAAIKTVQMKSPVVTRRSVDVSKLPPELASWVGKPVELFKASGGACEGTVAALAVLGRVHPHFGVLASWTGTGDFQGQPAVPAADIAKEAWSLSGSGGSAAGESGRVLVAEIRSEHGDCKGALWGRVLTNPKPALVEGKPADAKLQEQALTELKKTKAWTETQTRYDGEKEPKDAKEWSDFYGKTTSRVFTLPSGANIVTLSITAGSGCGTFGGTLSAAWEQRAGALTLVKEPGDGELLPTSAGDVDGDGVVDLLLPEVLMRKKTGKYTTTNKLVVPDLDCGC